MYQTQAPTLHWWFRLTTPKLALDPTFAQKEASRRSQVASLTISSITAFSFFPFLQALIQGNSIFATTMVITILINGFALYFNSRGQLRLAGLITLFFLLSGLTLTVLKTPGGLSFQSWRSLDLLAEDLVVVVAFFPAISVFGVACINILLILLVSYFGPHSSDFAHLLASSPYLLFYPPISLNAYISILTFIWVQSYARAVKELDQSEALVAAQKSRQETLEEINQLNQQLNEGISVLQNTLGAAANGDFMARAELLQENRLWHLARSLNLLLSRLASIRQQQQNAQITEQAIHAFAELIERSPQENLTVPLTGTSLDRVFVALSRRSSVTVHAQLPQQTPFSAKPFANKS
jgi:hypothetical protein